MTYLLKRGCHRHVVSQNIGNRTLRDCFYGGMQFRYLNYMCILLRYIYDLLLMLLLKTTNVKYKRHSVSVYFHKNNHNQFS